MSAETIAMRPASRGHSIETYCGKFFDYEDPQPEQVELVDIARALSQTCRYGGHTNVFYSVAEHALLCRHLIIEAGYPELSLAALHHDSHEAYIGDVPTPLKSLFSGYEEIAERIDVVITKRFGMAARDFNHPAVREVDRKALCWEVAALKRSHGIGGAWTLPPTEEAPPSWWTQSLGRWSHEQVTRHFMEAHWTGPWKGLATGPKL